MHNLHDVKRIIDENIKSLSLRSRMQKRKSQRDCAS